MPNLKEFFTKFKWRFRYLIWIELWDEELFHKTFSHAPKQVLNPITGKMRPLRGMHQFDNWHYIAVKYKNPEDLKQVLTHELTHCIQYEIFGIIYQKSLKIPRRIDPFEIWAYLSERLFGFDFW
jgi:hypothetical protein